MKTYHANVKRGSRYWFIYVPEVDRATQARHLRQVELMARDLVAVMEDVDPDSFELVVNLTLPEDARSHVEAAARWRIALGVSHHQRVSQLLKA